MIDTINNVNILHKHLLEDFKNIKDCTLHILDNYNIIGINNENTIDFYVNAFKNTNIRKIIFYYGVDKLDSSQESFIDDIAKNINSDFDKVYALIRMIGNFSNIKGLDFGIKISNEYMGRSFGFNKINSVVHFVRGLERNNISIEFQPYLKLTKKYLHGRYWIYNDLVKKIGYSIDGSFSTYPRGLVLAHLLDQEDFDIIYNKLNNEVIPNASRFQKLTADDLFAINSDIKTYLDFDINNID